MSLADSFDRRRCTGLKGKVQDLAYSLQMQNEEIGIEKNQLETIKSRFHLRRRLLYSANP